ncbi:hypothetical protein ACOSQ2_004048 [Xanthoceras sorbifolium]
MKLNNRFPEQTIELLTLSMTLNPVDGLVLVSVVFLVMVYLKRGFAAMIPFLIAFVFLVFRSVYYFSFSVFRKLIRLVLTLPVSTATTERAFSAMKLVKTPLRSKMENDFLTDCMVIYIEKEIADTIDLEHIIDEFDCIKSRKIKFK